MSRHQVSPAEPGPRPAAQREAVQRWRLVVSREAVIGDQAQRSQLAAWEAALGACGLPLAGLDGSPPKPRFAPAAPLGAAIRGEAELVDLWLVERLPLWQVREALETKMPPGHRLVDVSDVWLGEAPLPGQVVASVYRFELGTPSVASDALRSAAAAMLAARELLRRRPKGDGTVAYDLRPFIEALEVSQSEDGIRTLVRMRLRHDVEKGIGRPDELIAELGERLGQPLVVESLVRERLVLVPGRIARPARGESGTPAAAGSGSRTRR